MLRVNLLSFPVLPAPKVVQSIARRLVCAPNHRAQRLISAISLPTLTPELRNRLLGKAPLRFVASRAEVMPGKVWLETLECGHEVTAYQNFLWDEKSHLINLEPSAIRRRCQECKERAQHAEMESSWQNLETAKFTKKAPAQSLTVSTLAKFAQPLRSIRNLGRSVPNAGPTSQPTQPQSAVIKLAMPMPADTATDSLPPRKPVQGVTDPRKKAA